MKNQYQSVAYVVLEVGLQHLHPRHKSKHLSCQNLKFMIIFENGNQHIKVVIFNSLSTTSTTKSSYKYFCSYDNILI